MRARRGMSVVLWICVSFVLFFNVALAFYFPAVPPNNFSKGDVLNMYVDKLTSTKTQLPYSYYSLPYCSPEKIFDISNTLIDHLRGDLIQNSPYDIQMREPRRCNVLCLRILNTKTAEDLKGKLDDEYQVNMILDNLPLQFYVGLKGGYAGSYVDKYFIHNHLSFTVKFHKDQDMDLARIVGIEVIPYSVKHKYEGDWNGKSTRLSTCDPHEKTDFVYMDLQEVEDEGEIVFTYDVDFEESDVKWESRWDAYLLKSDDQLHWFSIIDSLITLLILSGIVAVIMRRTLARNISNYTQLNTQEESQEKTRWKCVHGDVFRPPLNSDLLSVFVGLGVQFFGSTLLALIFATLGFVSPETRGRFATAMILFWVFMGLFAGYFSASLYKVLNGTEWKKIAIKTGIVFPAFGFGIFILLNALVWGENSPGALPFVTWLVLVFLWIGISVPLVFVGSYIGFMKPAIEDIRVETNEITRQIPKQSWWRYPISILLGGFFTFSVICVELNYILNSIWLHRFYDLFGFLFIIFIILVITCSEITIVLCYVQLRREDYRWWWRSFFTSGSSAIYLFLYAVSFFTQLDINKPVSVALYFGYMLVGSCAFFMMSGTIGFFSCFCFTRLIFSNLNKRDSPC